MKCPIAIRRTLLSLTVPERFAKIGDPHAEMDASPGSLEKLLELADKDEAAGLARCALASALSQNGRRGCACDAFPRKICREEDSNKEAAREDAA